MKESCVVPIPINFNCWKHHYGFIKNQISACTNQKEFRNLKQTLLKIGNSQMDFYVGTLTPELISSFIINYLKSLNVLDPEKYNSWLTTEGKDFRQIKLEDKSIWTLRLGTKTERYIHIHPGRHSPNTLRVKAKTLKTTILVLCSEKINNEQKMSIKQINGLRKEYLGESPLKSISKETGLGKLIELFRSKG